MTSLWSASIDTEGSVFTSRNSAVFFFAVSVLCPFLALVVLIISVHY